MTTSLNANALTTVRAVELELGIDCGDASDDAEYIRRLINSKSTQIEKHLNRLLPFETGRVDLLKGYGLPRIVMKKWPVVTLTKVRLVGTKSPLIVEEIDLDEVKIEDSGESGILFRTFGWPDTSGRTRGITQDLLADTEERAIEVTFDGGYVTPKQAIDDNTLTRDLPDPIEDACVIAVVERFNRRGDTWGVKSERLLSHSVTYDVDRRSGLPREAVALLGPYRRIAVGAG